MGCTPRRTAFGEVGAGARKGLRVVSPVLGGGRRAGSRVVRERIGEGVGTVRSGSAGGPGEGVPTGAEAGSRSLSVPE
ncbi:hypothetical protein GCM10022244_54010 [Streptomyces gulbargensis]|uniref:Uncharacterized protein n=1 Tax=Streptomyces gulbargensis TaxID=364901 RepID=A0ABP7N9G9_9ACTN